MNKWLIEFCKVIFLITFAPPSRGCSFKNISESSSADRAPPCQGGGRGFEPRLPLFENIPIINSNIDARVVELVDTQDLKSCVH